MGILHCAAAVGTVVAGFVAVETRECLHEHDGKDGIQ
jgi:hypothetical protein